MKKFIFIYTIILLALLSHNAFATNWYVDKNAPGNNTGGSWTNAWESFSAINWGAIQPGDFLYISGRDAGGENDSTVYYETLTPQCQGTAANRITIIAGKYSPSPSGHSGRVIIDGQAQTRDNSILFDDYAGGSPAYITVKGFELREATGGIEFNIDDVTPPLAVGIIIDSLYIYDWYDLAGILVLGNTDGLIVQNCYISTFLDDGIQTDCFHFNGDDTYHARKTIIRNNVILNRNQDPLAHNDAIQSVVADGFVIYNNIIVNDSVYSPEGGGLPFILGDVDYHYNQAISNRNPVILYNNLCYMGGVWYSGGNMGYTMWTRYYSDEAHQPLTYVVNNTVVTNGPRVTGMGQEYEMSLVVNNINAHYCLPDGTLGENWRTDPSHGWQASFAANSGWSTTMPMDNIRNNLFWREDNNQNIFVGGYIYHTGGTGGISGWSDWVSKGGTGVNADPLFVTPFGHTQQRDILPDLGEGSPAIDAGEDIQPWIDFVYNTWGIVIPYTDIYGNDINGARDIGAFEFQSGVVDSIPTRNMPNITNALLDHLYERSTVFTGADTTFWVYAGGYDFHIGALSPYQTAWDTAHVNDTIYLKRTSAGQFSTGVSTPVTAGGRTTNWSIITSAAPDSIPNIFTFINYGYADLNSNYNYYSFKLTGYDSCSAYFDGADFAVYHNGSWGNFSPAIKKIYAPDSIKIQLTSASNYKEPVSAAFIAGGVSDTWYITTKGNGEVPYSFVVDTIQGEVQEALHSPDKVVDGKGALDGDLDSRWAARPQPKDLIFDLGTIVTIVKTRFSFYNWNTAPPRIYQYAIYVSDDYANWINIIPQKASADGQEWTIDSLNVGVEGRYLLLRLLSNNESEWANVWEAQILGTGAAALPADTTAFCSFLAVNGAELNSYHIGSSVLTGADTTFHIWTTSADSFKVGVLNSFNLTMVSALAGDTLFVSSVASGLYSTLERKTVIVSGFPRYYDVTTKAPPGGGGSGTITGGWLCGSDGRKLYDKNGVALIVRPP